MAYWEPRLRRLEELQASEERQRLEDLRVLQQRLDTLQAHIDAVTARLDALSAQLATIAADHGNLMTSLPVTLRQSARDLESLRARVDAARDPAPASQAR